jgi:hypothetical protein
MRRSQHQSIVRRWVSEPGKTSSRLGETENSCLGDSIVDLTDVTVKAYYNASEVNYQPGEAQERIQEGREKGTHQKWKKR